MTDETTLAVDRSHQREPWGWPIRVLRAPFLATAWVWERLLSRRALCLWFLLPVVVRTRGVWLRPPMSRDVHAFDLPLLPTPPDSELAAQLASGGGEFIWLSPGALMTGLIVIGILVALIRPKSFHWAAGLLLCGAIVGLASVALNHPELIARLDQQYRQRQELSVVLQETAHPRIEVVLVARVTDWIGSRRSLGSWQNGFVYLRYGGSMLMIIAAGLFFSMNGPLSRRLLHLGLWLLAGLSLAVGVTFDRWTAEREWHRAIGAHRRGEFESSDRYAQRAVTRLPQLAALERTWLLSGKLDYRLGRSSAAQDYFRAVQQVRNGEFAPGIARVERLARTGQPHRDVRRWMADLIAQQALARFQRGHHQAAEDLWNRAYELDATQVFRPLFVAALRARAEQPNPNAITAMVDPLLSSMADRSLRGALLAMLGDTYFKAGRITEARARYRDAVAAYSLPKHINYRAQRGLTGL